VFFIFIIKMTITEIIKEEIIMFFEKKKTVIRNGKRVKKLQCKHGFKALDNKCVKMSSAERMTRAKAQKKASRKRKPTNKKANAKRMKSMKKRKNIK